MSLLFSPPGAKLLRKLKCAAATIGVSVALASLAAPSFASCEYVVSNQWNSGFTGVIRVTNDSAVSVSGWNVAWQYTAGDQITSSWNANVSGSNPYMASNLNWNGALGVGQTAEFGFQGSKGGTQAEIPSVTGTLCDGGVVASSSSSAASSTPSSSSSVSSSLSSISSSSVASSSVASSVSSSSAPSSVSSSSLASSLPQSSSSSSIAMGDGDDWLHVEQNKIVDANGRAVWLTGLNWFGFNCSERVFHGLWSAYFPDVMKSIADRGFNLIRVPISTELLLEWKAGVFGTVNVNTYANPELEGLNSLQIFDQTLKLAKQNGIKILLDMHSAEADNSGHVYPLWTHAEFTEEDFYDAWTWVAERYKNDDTIVGFDLENEPHGKAYSETSFAIWNDSDAPNNWKRVAQEAATRVLAINPNVLILVEGIETYPKDGADWSSRDEDDYYGTWWGGNLRAVRDYPITVPGHQSQIMYSPHDYGPSVFNQAWFYDGFSKETLIDDVWYDNWLYLHDEQMSPLLIGEWGGFLDGGKNEAWMADLRELMIEKKIHHTFWCLNPNSGDTGGLLGYDWATWNEAKYDFVKPALWQLNGRFVGLDHATPLGSNGLSVNQYYQQGGLEPIGD